MYGGMSFNAGVKLSCKSDSDLLAYTFNLNKPFRKILEEPSS